MGQIKWTLSILFAALFSIAIITFVFNFQSENDAATLLSEDPTLQDLNIEMNSSVKAFLEEDVNSSTEAFFLSQVAAGDETTATGGQFKTGLSNMRNVIFVMTKILWQKVFGEGNEFGIFLTAIVSVIVLVTVLYLYKSWVGKNPD